MKPVSSFAPFNEIFYFRFLNFVCISFTISEPSSNSKEVMSSPRNRRSHLTDSPQSASHRRSESQNCQIQTKATYTQLKSSPRAQKTIKHQASPPLTSGKKQTDTPTKGKRLSKQHKTEESSTGMDSPDIPLEEIMKLFKPILPCISPLPDLVRIQI